MRREREREVVTVCFSSLHDPALSSLEGRLERTWPVRGDAISAPSAASEASNAMSARRTPRSVGSLYTFIRTATQDEDPPRERAGCASVENFFRYSAAVARPVRPNVVLGSFYVFSVTTILLSTSELYEHESQDRSYYCTCSSHTYRLALMDWLINH